MTRLKQLREDAVLTVHELAKTSGVSDDTISKIENGQRVARPSTLRKLASALGVSPQELRRPAKVEELALAGKAEAPTSGPSQGIMITGPALRVGYWIETLETNADAYEEVLEGGAFSLALIQKVEYAAVELAGLYGKHHREMRSLASDGQWQMLEAAKERIRSVRRRLRDASREKFEEERDHIDPGKVRSIEQKRAELDQRVEQEERDAS
jgi:transcriptional regulator with XRE-family HTH domain